MRYIATLLLLLVSASASGQAVKKALKFATFYTAFSGGTLSQIKRYSLWVTGSRQTYSRHHSTTLHSRGA